MKHIFIFIVFILLSCLQKENDNNVIFFEDYPNSQLWKGNTIFDIEKMKQLEGRRKYTRCSYDPITNKIWAWNIDDEISYCFLADVTDGKYVQDKEIFFEIPNKLAPQFVFLFNDFALIEYRWGIYGIADLNNTQQILVDLRNVLNKYNTLGTIGYDYENIFFVNGILNIISSEYFDYEIIIKLPRIISSENMIIGLDNNNFIILYNYINGNIEITTINIHNNFNYLDYRPSDLYFLCNDKLFFSKDVFNFHNVFAFFRQPAYRRWYVYDLATKKVINIFSPSGYAKIIGYHYSEKLISYPCFPGGRE